MKPSAPLAVVAGLTLALSVTGCTDPSVSATMKSIDSIGTVSIESKDANDAKCLTDTAFLTEILYHGILP